MSPKKLRSLFLASINIPTVISVKRALRTRVVTIVILDTVMHFSFASCVTRAIDRIDRAQGGKESLSVAIVDEFYIFDLI